MQNIEIKCIYQKNVFKFNLYVYFLYVIYIYNLSFFSAKFEKLYIIFFSFLFKKCIKINSAPI